MEQYESSYSEFINPETTFPAAIHSWEIFLANDGKSANTIKAFTADIQLLASWLPPDRKIGAITSLDLTNFLDWMKHKRKVSCSEKTYSRRITSIKSFFRWLKNFGIIAVDPAESVVQITVYAPVPDILTIEELPRVLETANAFRFQKKPDVRPMALVQLLLATGIKKSETLAIAPNHIDLDDPEDPILHVRYNVGSQRFKERKLPLPIDWVPVYNDLLTQEKPTDRIFPYSARMLEYLLADVGKAAGLEDQAQNPKHLSFNMCRWTSAVHDLYINVPEEFIRNKMGVSKVQWRDIYRKLVRLKDVYAGKTSVEELRSEKSSEE